MDLLVSDSLSLDDSMDSGRSVFEPFEKEGEEIVKSLKVEWFLFVHWGFRPDTVYI